MHNINKLVDVSSWTGNWPFYDLRYKELDVLKQKLQDVNVVKSFIAPIDAILDFDPVRANKKLLSDITDDFFSPVLILNLSYANWEDVLELALKDGRVKMVKLLPNYHMFEVCEESLEKLVTLTMKNNLLISLQVRVEDIRGSYPLMIVNDVPIFKIIKTLSYFPDQTFILNNLYYSEVPQILSSLSNVYVDIASVETLTTMKKVYDGFGLDKLLFSTHCPFYYPEGTIYKLKYSELDISEIEKVAFRNAEKIL